jgi:hypothetical protein
MVSNCPLIGKARVANLTGVPDSAVVALSMQPR